MFVRSQKLLGDLKPASAEPAQESGFVFRELEPRIAFDAAMAATVTEISSDAPDASPPASEPASEMDGSADLMEALAASPASAAEPREIIFVDMAVADIDTLTQAFSSEHEVYILDSTRDGLEQIAEILSGYGDVSAVHIFSHGSQAELTLGTGRLGLDTS